MGSNLGPPWPGGDSVIFTGRNLIILWFILFGLFYMFLTSGCSTTRAYKPYYERCHAATWEYYGSSMPNSSEDQLMEHSGRRACIRFQGDDACLISMRKLSDVDYVALCRRDANINLKRN